MDGEQAVEEEESHAKQRPSSETSNTDATGEDAT